VRHGEVHNPDGVLYGRIPGFGLSDLGRRMAAVAADSLSEHPITALYTSPLQRARESAAPWAEATGLLPVVEPRIVEPTNRFEGGTVEFGPAVLLHPRTWPLVYNPFRPSWGEPYVEVAMRMIAALDSAWHTADGGEVVLVSHQLPIVMVQRAVAGKHLWHDPRDRRCSLSSITTVERCIARSGEPRYREVSYREPAADLLRHAVDQGAV
jgi:broad specificity phosphatase PhoE